LSKHKTKVQQQQEELDESEWQKRREEQERFEQKKRDNEEREKFGTVTYERRPDNSPQVTVIPVEIEVPWALDQLVKFEILSELGYSYRQWVEECYIHRMKEILTDPAEFGKVVLEPIKRSHCLQDEDLEDC
jgi:hypothetical protein